MIMLMVYTQELLKVVVSLKAIYYYLCVFEVQK